ncbi:MAG: CpsD/CapB family tyrosine-protein kinase [Candidatus Acidiferrales bacterium]
MSRIHEALKKAEQERAAIQAAEGSSAPAEKIAVATAIPSEIPAVPLEAANAVSQARYLRFNDLLAACSQPHWHFDPNADVFGSDEHAVGAEQFRTLRSRLYQLRGAQPLRTILVTSSVPAEGKTFVTNNLAQAIVRQPDRRALMIDADLRCSRLHVPLGAPAAPGLTDYLKGEADEMAVIQHGDGGNLCFIPGGNEVSNPSELIANGRLKTLFERVIPVFDWVIIDSPPCLPVHDASMLAEMCDGVLLVVRAGSTPSEVAQRACQELQDKRMIGVVLNAVEQSHGYGSYYYQQYGYGQGIPKDGANR